MDIEKYFKIAQNEAYCSNCLRRHIGAVIVKNDIIIGKGANKVPERIKSCSDKGWCIRNELNIPRGKGYDICNSVHAEINAIQSVANNILLTNSVMYLVGYDAVTERIVDNLGCCEKCKDSIVTAGIKLVYIKQDDNHYIKVLVENWKRENN